MGAGASSWLPGSDPEKNAPGGPDVQGRTNVASAWMTRNDLFGDFLLAAQDQFARSESEQLQLARRAKSMDG